MYTYYITYSFLMAIRHHVCDPWNMTKQKEIEKIMQCPFIKSPFLWYGISFFLKGKYNYAFIIFKMKKKTHFLMEFHPKTFLFLNCFIFNWCILISYITKNSPQNSINNLTFKVHIQTFKLCDEYYLVTNIFHTFKFFNVCWNFQNNWLD